MHNNILNAGRSTLLCDVMFMYSVSLETSVIDMLSSKEDYTTVLSYDPNEPINMALGENVFTAEFIVQFAWSSLVYILLCVLFHNLGQSPHPILYHYFNYYT